MYTAVVTRFEGLQQTTTEHPIKNHTEWKEFAQSLRPCPSCIGVSHDAYDTIVTHRRKDRLIHILATLHRNDGTTPKSSK